MDRNKHIKCKVQPKTCHEDREVEYRHNFTLSLTWALDGVCCQRLSSAALHPGKRVGTHWIGGRVGPTAGAEDLALTGVRTPNHPASNKSLYKLPTLTQFNNFFLYLLLLYHPSYYRL